RARKIVTSTAIAPLKTVCLPFADSSVPCCPPSLTNFTVLFLSGIRSWDVDLKCCDLDQQLQLFITRHSAHFSTEVRGQSDVAP
uniref:Microtubule-associated protein 1B/S N-terminal domain-containing protein n=1 Tax=Nothobranchius furzeri TaxID=105023 RepID=A0A8C6M763_NOTFU